MIPASVQVNKRILIVDGDPAIHAMLDVILKSGDRVLEDAYSGAEAHEILKKKPVDLVLADIYMPGIDGLTLLQQVRLEQPQASVVIMTAETAPQAVIHSISSQAFGYISKPFTAQAMSELVSGALQGEADDDDITILSAKPEWLTLNIRCKIAVAERLTNFVREFLSDINPDDRDSISAAFRELLMNAIEHGGKSDPSQTVHLTYIRTARSLIYIIRDPGEGFSFDNLSHAAIANSEEAPFEHVKVRSQMGIRPGGFGILLTKNLADELLYNAKGNEVMLVKYLDRREGCRQARP